LFEISNKKAYRKKKHNTEPYSLWWVKVLNSLHNMLMCLQLKEEFAFIAKDSRPLINEFQPIKTKVLKLATSNAAAMTILADIDESDEGN